MLPLQPSEWIADFTNVCSWQETAEQLFSNACYELFDLPVDVRSHTLNQVCCEQRGLDEAHGSIQENLTLLLAAHDIYATEGSTSERGSRILNLMRILQMEFYWSIAKFYRRLDECGTIDAADASSPDPYTADNDIWSDLSRA